MSDGLTKEMNAQVRADTDLHALILEKTLKRMTREIASLREKNEELRRLNRDVYERGNKELALRREVEARARALLAHHDQQLDIIASLYTAHEATQQDLDALRLEMLDLEQVVEAAQTPEQKKDAEWDTAEAELAAMEGPKNV